MGCLQNVSFTKFTEIYSRLKKKKNKRQEEKKLLCFHLRQMIRTPALLESVGRSLGYYKYLHVCIPHSVAVSLKNYPLYACFFFKRDVIII